MTKPVFRFAPSPNGYLHLGHAFSALFCWHAARKAGGDVLLRIEDIDTRRCRQAYVDQIFDDLAWLGLSWREPVRVQSEHFDDYRKAAAILSDKGLLYPCFCTRKQVLAKAQGLCDPDGAVRYPGTCKHLSAEAVAERQNSGEAFALRLDMAKAIAMARAEASVGANIGMEADGPIGQQYSNLEDWGDVVLVRKDTPTSYHLAVVVDDDLQGVTHVTRGMDMYGATALHLLLQNLLGLARPHYQHHELIKGDSGQKLAKSAGDLSLKQLRADGLQMADLLKFPDFSQYSFK